MATLVLSTIGTMVAGPIGGAIGAIVGQVIDQEVLFKPKVRQGPRLNELAVQTSAYGTAIPAIYGAMRVSGTVIWATDLREEKTRTGGGKGRPSVTNYSYTASFAVLLSARGVQRVGRIWADGNLMRGAAGDFKVATGFRLHRGGEDQPVDPLIAAAEGALAPAHRGQAYALFEDLDLGPYGNRIPSLSFELIADEAPVAVSAIAADVGGVDADGATTVGGFATGGDSARGVIETLSMIAPMTIVESGAGVALSETARAPVVIAADELRASEGTRAGRTGPLETLPPPPVETAITYYEPARDYQAGLQRARRPGAGRRVEAIDLPVAVEAGAAKAIAERVIERRWSERQRMRIALPWSRLALDPGDRVRVAGVPGVWRIVGWTFEATVLLLDLVRERPGSTPALLPAAPGRSVRPPDLIHGPTTLVPLDLPWLGEGRAPGPALMAAAAGVSPGWRSAALLVSRDGGARYDAAGPTAAPATIGTMIDALPPGPAGLIDRRGVATVRLLNGAMTLEDCDAAGLIDGRNLAAIGGELVQFGRAAPIGGGLWRLSELVRGRRGSEWAIDRHVSGEAFVLIEPGTLASVPLPPDASGTEIDLLAAGAGDPPEGVARRILFTAEALRPPSPARLRIEPEGDGSRIAWTRRSREGWSWLDAVDAPLSEGQERYRLSIAPDGGPARIVETDAPTHPYPASEMAADRAGGRAVTIAVTQIGDHGASREAVLRIAPTI